MRLLKSLIISVIVVGLSAASASALTSVTYTADQASIEFDGTGTQQLTVTATASFDGTDALTGIFTSATFDESVLQLVSVADRAGFLFFSSPVSPFLSNQVASGVVNFGGDPSNLIRVAQYTTTNQNAQIGASAGDELITTMVFNVIGGGNGNVGVVFGLDDIILTDGATQLTDSVTTVTVVPEPGTALLMGLGLAGLGAAGRRNR